LTREPATKISQPPGILNLQLPEVDDGDIPGTDRPSDLQRRRGEIHWTNPKCTGQVNSGIHLSMRVLCIQSDCRVENSVENINRSFRLNPPVVNRTQRLTFRAQRTTEKYGNCENRDHSDDRPSQIS